MPLVFSVRWLCEKCGDEFGSNAAVRVESLPVNMPGFQVAHTPKDWSVDRGEVKCPRCRSRIHVVRPGELPVLAGSH